MRCRTICRTVTAAAVAVLLWNCSGSGKSGAGNDTITEEEAAELILSSPQVFDDQSLTDLAAKVRNNEEFGPEALANMIVLCDATVNRVEQDAEQLQVIDDPVDTYERLTGYASQPWMADYRTVYDYLVAASLPGEYAERVDMLKKAAQRLNAIITDLERVHLQGKNVIDF